MPQLTSALLHYVLTAQTTASLYTYVKHIYIRVCYFNIYKPPLHTQVLTPLSSLPMEYMCLLSAVKAMSLTVPFILRSHTHCLLCSGEGEGRGRGGGEEGEEGGEEGEEGRGRGGEGHAHVHVHHSSNSRFTQSAHISSVRCTYICMCKYRKCTYTYMHSVSNVCCVLHSPHPSQPSALTPHSPHSHTPDPSMPSSLTALTPHSPHSHTPDPSLPSFLTPLILTALTLTHTVSTPHPPPLIVITFTPHSSHPHPSQPTPSLLTPLTVTPHALTPHSSHPAREKNHVAILSEEYNMLVVRGNGKPVKCLLTVTCRRETQAACRCVVFTCLCVQK